MKLLLIGVFLAAASAFAQELPREPGAVWDPRGELTPAGSRMIGEAVAQASRVSGERFLFVFQRPKEMETSDFLKKATAVWGDRNILFVLPGDLHVQLHTTDEAEKHLADDLTRSWVTQISHSLNRQDTTYEKTSARVIRELGDSIAGHPPAPWNAWAHPFLTLSGGQDSVPWPWPVYLLITLGLLTAAFFLLRGIISDPVGFVVGLTFAAVGLAIDGAIDGGGGGGGGGFSGAGGSFGGGGASGSW